MHAPVISLWQAAVRCPCPTVAGLRRCARGERHRQLKIAGTTSHACAQHAVDYLIERVLAEPNEISIFPIGPLTNIAMAIRKEPRFADAVKELVIMGGAILEHGNMTPQAEFNIYVDPHAAHIVFHSGIPITLIPLDVTHKCLLKQEHVDRLMQIDSPIYALHPGCDGSLPGSFVCTRI